MRTIYLLVGSPGSGKTWVSSQLKDSFEIREHDHYRDLSTYVAVLKMAVAQSSKDIIANTPFGVSEIMHRLALGGVKCVPLFIIEEPNVLRARYFAREQKEIPKGHLTRQNTYFERAQDLNAFKGTSEDVFRHLKSIEIAKKES